MPKVLSNMLSVSGVTPSFCTKVIPEISASTVFEPVEAQETLPVVCPFTLVATDG